MIKKKKKKTVYVRPYVLLFSLIWKIQSASSSCSASMHRPFFQLQFIISFIKQNMLHEQAFPQGLIFNFPEFGEALSTKFLSTVENNAVFVTHKSILSSNMHPTVDYRLAELSAQCPITNCPYSKMTSFQQAVPLYYVLPGFTVQHIVKQGDGFKAPDLLVFKLRQVARCYFRASLGQLVINLSTSKL